MFKDHDEDDNDDNIRRCKVYLFEMCVKVFECFLCECWTLEMMNNYYYTCIPEASSFVSHHLFQRLFKYFFFVNFFETKTF